VRRLLLASAAALALLAPAASAAPLIVPAIATAVGAGAFGTFVIGLGVSLALTGISMLLAPKPGRMAGPQANGLSAPDVKRSLAQQSSRPPYRFAYGRDQIAGSPAPWRVKKRRLYGCLIFNSRPSEIASFTVKFDKRTVTLTGDPYDFAGPGASGSFNGLGGAPAPLIWIGRGDQTRPPVAITDDVPEFFETTDKWRGLTVMWLVLHAGGNDERPERWPRVPPLVEVNARWSKVWDPRESGQDPDDPDTWTYSANQALCLLDALRRNPIRRYGLNMIDLASFIDGADVADEQVPLLAGGTERRYQAHGMIVWDRREIMEQVEPIADSGAGRLVRIGGRIGYAAGAWRAPSYTATDVIGDGVDYQVLQPGREVPAGIRASYVSPGRSWRSAELPPIAVAGSGLSADEEGVAELPLPFCTSATQAMRIQQIAARRAALQRTISCTLPPSSANLVTGATMTMALPAAFARLNGAFEVESANPGLWVQDREGGVALRNPVTLRETAESVYAWDPNTDELDLAEATFSGDVPTPDAPVSMAATSGASVAKRKRPRIRWEFEPVDGADYYEVQWWITGETRGRIRRVPENATDPDGDVRGFIGTVVVGEEYTIRARAVIDIGRRRKKSGWTSITIVALPPDLDLDPPINGSATAGSGEITAEFTNSDGEDVFNMEIWAADVDDVDQATRIKRTWRGADETISATETGLSTGQRRYYWARSRAQYQGVFSSWTASVTAVAL